MALSNILREPRREIIESVVGIAAFLVCVWLDSFFARWFHEVTGGDHGGCPVPLGYLFGLLAAVLLVICVFATHALGETVCGFLANRGMEIRPKQRYR